MRLITPILCFLFLGASAQTSVQALSFSKMNGIAKGSTRGIVTTPNSWAEYSVSVPSGGVYNFAFTIKNTKTPANITVKTPTGDTQLGNVSVPTVAYWRYVRTQVRLRAGTRNLRLLFNGNIQMEAFKYELSPEALQKPSADKFVTKDEFNQLVQRINNMAIYFDRDDFGGTGSDSTNPITILRKE